ncbi:MAG: carboxypeptidase regulatory-like domain-containing protein [Bryobacterales bacterium]|nr:carboxypeptidase regulatory-like domain-containing protein [Bryobacterales bacterium]
MARMIALALLSIAAMSQTIQPAASGGRIQGRVAGVSGGAIAAVIRIIPTGSDVVVLRVRGEQNGMFRTEPLPAGSYTVTAWSQGFRRRELTGVAVRHEAETNLGDILLDISGCDAPGVMCDSFGLTAPNPEKTVTSSGYLRLKLACGADFETGGKVHCPETVAGQEQAPLKGVDLQFEKNGVHLSLAAVDGASLSRPISSGFDCHGAKFGEDKLRIETLGMGVDFCVRTKRGAMSHVFFTNDVDRQDTEIVLWHVTRKR